jgi:hypothetical protein
VDDVAEGVAAAVVLHGGEMSSQSYASFEVEWSRSSNRSISFKIKGSRPVALHAVRHRAVATLACGATRDRGGGSDGVKTHGREQTVVRAKKRRILKNAVLKLWNGSISGLQLLRRRVFAQDARSRVHRGKFSI